MVGIHKRNFAIANFKYKMVNLTEAQSYKIPSNNPKTANHFKTSKQG